MHFTGAPVDSAKQRKDEKKDEKKKKVETLTKALNSGYGKNFFTAPNLKCVHYLRAGGPEIFYY